MASLQRAQGYERYFWECNQNYHLMSKLLPLAFEVGTHLSLGCMQNGKLKAYVLQRHAFTDIFCLQSSLISHLSWLKNYVIELRLYHDVSSAEITGFQVHSECLVDECTVDFKRCIDLNQKWQLNLFLFETLMYFTNQKAKK